MRGMERYRHLARAIADMGFHDFRRQLEYRAAMRGGRVVVADRYSASSKTCPACGPGRDRDVDAPINLR